MSEQAREVHPFSLDVAPEDRSFNPVLLPAGDEAPDPKDSSVPVPAEFSDTIPQMEPEESDLSGSAATKPAAKVTTPPRAPRPGKPAS